MNDYLFITVFSLFTYIVGHLLITGDMRLMLVLQYLREELQLAISQRQVLPTVTPFSAQDLAVI